MNEYKRYIVIQQPNCSFVWQEVKRNESFEVLTPIYTTNIRQEAIELTRELNKIILDETSRVKITTKNYVFRYNADTDMFEQVHSEFKHVGDCLIELLHRKNDKVEDLKIKNQSLEVEISILKRILLDYYKKLNHKSDEDILKEIQTELYGENAPLKLLTEELEKRQKN